MKHPGRVLTDLTGRLWRRSVHLLQERTLLSFTSIFIFLIGCASIVFDYTEQDGKSGTWRAIVYMLSGIDVDPPESAVGEAAAAIILVLGVIFVSLLTGYIAAEFSRILISFRSVMTKPESRIFEDHVIFFGWGAKTKSILRELNADYRAFSLEADDYVVLSDKEYIEKGTEQIYSNVWHVRGKSGDVESLRRADLTPHRGSGARVAAILSDSSLPDDEADRRSLLTLLAVEHLHPEVVSLVEVRREESEEHFENAYADNVIVPKRYGDYLLARTSEFPGVASYVDELLALAPSDSSHGRNPISLYVRSSADLKVSGMTLAEAVSAYNGRKQGIIVGSMLEDTIELLPDSDAWDRILAPDMKLVVAATPEQV